MRRSDTDLVHAIRAGRREAFGELIDRHAPAVFRLVRASIRNDADAEDVAQEVFLASFRALPRLRDPGRFRAHLIAIAARKIVDWIRRRARCPESALDHEPLAPEPTAGPDRRLETVARVVGDLAPDARLVFALRHHEGMSCVQIAELLGRPEGTIYSRLSRIHAAIRRAVEVGER